VTREVAPADFFVAEHLKLLGWNFANSFLAVSQILSDCD
jgi:hypothetical protein